MNGLTLRSARPEDVDHLSDIVNDPPARSALKIAGSHDKAIRGGRILCRKGISLQIAHCTVAELDGTIVAVMDAAPNRQDPDLGVGLVLRLLRSRPAFARPSFETPTDSYYIAELDVEERFRNRGIGAALLREGEAQARHAKCSTMAHSTDITTPAQRLYERAGFRIIETKRDAEYERWSASPGRVLMVKDLGATG